jgi:AcrR family transcriptional regulator
VSERADRVRRSVVETTLEMLDECGVAGFSIEQLAARSGVAKTTIYRHWPHKVDVVVEAMHSHHEDVPTPNTGDLRADLRACFEFVRDRELQARMGRIIPSLLDAAQRDPEFAQLHERLTSQRKQPLRTVLELAQLRGMLRDDIDLDDAVDLVLGPLVSRSLLSRVEIDEHFLDLVVDTAVRALAVPALR